MSGATHTGGDITERTDRWEGEGEGEIGKMMVGIVCVCVYIYDRYCKCVCVCVCVKGRPEEEGRGASYQVLTHEGSPQAEKLLIPECVYGCQSVHHLLED